jgi:hypothetical protein
MPQAPEPVSPVESIVAEPLAAAVAVQVFAQSVEAVVTGVSAVKVTPLPVVVGTGREPVWLEAIPRTTRRSPVCQDTLVPVDFAPLPTQVVSA